MTVATRQKHQLSPLLLDLVLCGVNILLLLRSFHWLPTQARIEYKLSTFCHSFFSDTAPVYLSALLHVHCPSRQTHSSSDSRTLSIPHGMTRTVGHRGLFPLTEVLCVWVCACVYMNSFVYHVCNVGFVCFL